MTVRGGCLCGAVQIEIGTPIWCAHCHCSMCRRAHTAAFVTWVGTVAADFHVVSGEAALEHYPSSTGATRSFCRRCGSTLLFQSRRWAGEVHVARAAFADDADLPPPAGHAFWDDRAHWYEARDELPRRGGESGTEPL